MDLKDQLIVLGLILILIAGAALILYVIKKIIDFKGEAVKLPSVKPEKPENW